MKEYSYQIFVPGGNDTALVLGIEEDLQIRRAINDTIMERFPNVEQVGFLSENVENPQLMMAGGEFCGNATRCAAWHYLQGAPGEIFLQVSGVQGLLRAGVRADRTVWAQMPVYRELDCVKEIDKGFFLAPLQGIIHIVVLPEQAAPYLVQGGNIKAAGKEILSRFEIAPHIDAGVIFLEHTASAWNIHPYVYVAKLQTMFYETACGSGTIAAGLVMAYIRGESIEVSLVQPSGKELRAVVHCQGRKVTKALISGEIKTDGVFYRG